MELHLLPLLVAIIFPATFVTTYSIAVHLDHIYPFFSYISDTGTISPELCIFALGLNLAAFFFVGVVYVRFKQIESFFFGDYKGKIKKMNEVGVFFGLVSALGSSVVGCFQESNVLSVHIIGAWMAFLGGSIFLIIQAWFTFQMAPTYGSRGLGTLRMILGIACFFLFFISYTCGALSFKHFIGDKALKWEPEDGGWGYRVTSVVAEWVMASLFDLYFLTFVPEFKEIVYQPPTLRHRSSQHGGNIPMKFQADQNDNSL